MGGIQRNQGECGHGTSGFWFSPPFPFGWKCRFYLDLSSIEAEISYGMPSLLGGDPGVPGDWLCTKVGSSMLYT